MNYGKLIKKISTFEDGKAIKKYEEMLQEFSQLAGDDEILLNAVTGSNKGDSMPGILFATNKRICFITRSFFRKKISVNNIPIDKVSSIEYSKGWLSSKILIYTANAAMQIEHINTDEAPKFCNQVKKSMEVLAPQPYPAAPMYQQPQATAPQQKDFIQELKELGQLKQEGIITDEEFKLAKEKLLK